MIDIHCHIVPNVDDGASSIEEALEMARIAVEDGIEVIINTSHYYIESDFIMGKELEDRIEAFNDILAENNIELEIFIGNELYYDRDLIKNLDNIDFYSLNKSRFILIEFPVDNIPENMDDIIYEFIIRGYIPIIAHIERYPSIVKNPNLVYEYINNGALIQINSSSITGKMGKEIKNFTDILLNNDMVHFIGSDAHSSKRRKPHLKNAYEYVNQLIGKEKTDIIFYKNTNALLENKEINIISPKEYKEKGLLSKLKSIFMK